MAQNLPAPCFQVYAATTLAAIPFRKASFAERGLLFTMLCELWINSRLPSNVSELALILNKPENEIELLLPKVMPFFGNDDRGIFSQQLDDYLAHLNAIRAKQSKGGKHGVAIRESKKSKPETSVNTSDYASKVHHKVDHKVLSIVKQSTVKQSQDQLAVREITNNAFKDSFIKDYETIDDYENPFDSESIDSFEPPF